jgi:hypothetical protein
MGARSGSRTRFDPAADRGDASRATELAVFERLPNSGAPTEFCCSPAPLLWRCDVERMRIDNEVLRPRDRRLSSTLIRCNPLLGATLGLGAPITIARLSEPGATPLQRDRP